jgi:diguanylate cyclase (GGDEF)-like protein
MKIPNFLINKIDPSEEKDFQTKMVLDNIRRGRILALLVIGYEAVLIFIDMLASWLKVDNRFAFDAYIVMYVIMAAMNVMFLLLTRGADKKNAISDDQIIRWRIVVIAYVTLILAWGSVLSLLDQRLYGQVMAFMVNLSVCSVIFLMDNKKILFSYLISVAILASGLPFFQRSSDILIGHYANLFIFILLSWLLSRVLYHNYCESYTDNVLLKKTNLLLEIEIGENRIVNKKLAAANGQLKELTLLDELTGIPNRRSFREFIDRAFQPYATENSTISVIMMDFDYFKQFNDCYGHEAGDKALIAIANEINSVVEEPAEFVARWGGEEFVYVAFGKSPGEIAETAEAIRTKVSRLKIAHTASPVFPYVTLSLGISTVRITDKRDIGRTIALADSALYMAKDSGRNCVRSLGNETERPQYETE